MTNRFFEIRPQYQAMVISRKGSSTYEILPFNDEIEFTREAIKHSNNGSKIHGLYEGINWPELMDLLIKVRGANRGKHYNFSIDLR